MTIFMHLFIMHFPEGSRGAPQLILDRWMMAMKLINLEHLEHKRTMIDELVFFLCKEVVAT
jgi:hypothetical protein